MVTMEDLLSIEKKDLEERSKSLSKEDLSQLVEWLSEKEDMLRYHSLLMLQYRSQFFDDVYPYWDIFCSKLKSDNSYQRNIGVMLIAENARWDRENKLMNTIDEYLLILNDEKPITIRQCIQSLNRIVTSTAKFNDIIAEKLTSIHIEEMRETMRKLILMDILNILVLIQKSNRKKEIDIFISNALTGGILDNKSIKQIEKLL